MEALDCKKCQLYSDSLYLSCTVHPHGPAPKGCLDFAPVAAAIAKEEDELWFPYGWGRYAGEVIAAPLSQLTTEDQLALLDSHPLFIGCCPECGWKFESPNPPVVHWDCSACGWKDDSV